MNYVHSFIRDDCEYIHINTGRRSPGDSFVNHTVETGFFGASIHKVLAFGSCMECSSEQDSNFPQLEER